MTCFPADQAKASPKSQSEQEMQNSINVAKVEIVKGYQNTTHVHHTDLRNPCKTELCACLQNAVIAFRQQAAYLG